MIRNGNAWSWPNDEVRSSLHPFHYDDPDTAMKTMAHNALARAFVFYAIIAIPAVFAQDVHFSPEERLDAIDRALIDSAKQSIDFASYSLTDIVVLDALNAAERRGVAVRIVLDPRQRPDFV